MDSIALENGGYLARSDQPPIVLIGRDNVERAGAVISARDAYWRGIRVSPGLYHAQIHAIGIDEQCVEWWKNHLTNLGFGMVSVDWFRPNGNDQPRVEFLTWRNEKQFLSDCRK